MLAEAGPRSLLRHGTSQSQSSVLVTEPGLATSGSDIIPAIATSPVTSSKSLSPQNKTRGGRGSGGGSGSRRVPGFPQRVTSVTSVTSDNVQLTTGAVGHNTVDIELDTAAAAVSKHSNLPLKLLGTIFTWNFWSF